jgi:hypothetical protein
LIADALLRSRVGGCARTKAGNEESTSALLPAVSSLSTPADVVVVDYELGGM